MCVPILKFILSLLSLLTFIIFSSRIYLPPFRKVIKPKIWFHFKLFSSPLHSHQNIKPFTIPLCPSPKHLNLSTDHHPFCHFPSSHPSPPISFTRYLLPSILDGLLVLRLTPFLFILHVAPQVAFWNKTWSLLTLL